MLAKCFGFTKPFSGQYLLYRGVNTMYVLYTLNVPPYSKYWPEDGLVKPKYVAKTMYY